MNGLCPPVWRAAGLSDGAPIMTISLKTIAQLGASALFLAACATDTAPSNAHAIPGWGEPTLSEVRRLTEKYQDLNVALAEGYIRDPANMCESAEMMGLPAARGAMGVHYFRPDLLGVTAPPSPRVDGNGTYTNFRHPAILIYEPQADGSMQLVAVENLVFQRAWRESGHNAPPTFHGVEYDNMADNPATAVDEAHNFEPHFDRHVWIYRANPNGVFQPLNPTVTCAHHGHSAASMAH